MNFIILIILLLSNAIQPLDKPQSLYFAGATIEYAIVSTDDAYIYLDQTMQTDSQLFIIPKTYFVKVLQKSESFYKVEYAFDSVSYCSIVGYMNSSKILISSPTTKPFNFECKLNKISNPILYTDSNLANGQLPIMRDETYFYGKITSKNELLYFVRYDDYVGYVKASAFQPFEIANHPDYVPPKEPLPPNGNGNGNIDNNVTVESSKSNAIEIIMIIVICVPALIIVILLFKAPKKPKQQNDVYHRDMYPPYDRDNYKE